MLAALGLQLGLQQPAPGRGGQVTTGLGSAPHVRGRRQTRNRGAAKHMAAASARTNRGRTRTPRGTDWQAGQPVLSEDGTRGHTRTPGLRSFSGHPLPYSSLCAVYCLGLRDCLHVKMSPAEINFLQHHLHKRYLHLPKAHENLLVKTKP